MVIGIIIIIKERNGREGKGKGWDRTGREERRWDGKEEKEMFFCFFSRLVAS